MKDFKKLKVILLIGCLSVALPVYPAAADNRHNNYKGELASGYTHDGKLGSDELWMFHGKKDGHIVIATAVDKGKTPPGVFLYPPEKSGYEVRSDQVSDRLQVLDYKLEEPGRFAVLIHPCGAGDKSSYRIAYSILNSGDQYTINPDDPEDLLTVTTPEDRSDKFFVDRSHGLLPGAVVFNVVTFGVGPVISTGLSAVNQVVVGVERLNDRSYMESLDLNAPPAMCSSTARG